jgi:hypothetical protein
MSDAQLQNNSPDEKISVTLKLDAKVYESFLQKAQKAGVEIEPYLSSTLSIVLGCRVFNTTYACSPQLVVAASAPDCQKVMA